MCFMQPVFPISTVDMAISGLQNFSFTKCLTGCSTPTASRLPLISLSNFNAKATTKIHKPSSGRISDYNLKSPWNKKIEVGEWKASRTYYVFPIWYTTINYPHLLMLQLLILCWTLDYSPSHIFFPREILASIVNQEEIFLI